MTFLRSYENIAICTYELRPPKTLLYWYPCQYGWLALVRDVGMYRHIHGYSRLSCTFNPSYPLPRRHKLIDRRGMHMLFFYVA